MPWWRTPFAALQETRVNLVQKIEQVHSCLPLAAILAIGVGAPGYTDAQEVKQSGSGICHCPGGQFYDRTTNYTPFDSIDACLASGGREPQRGQGDCSTATSSDSRDTNAGTGNAVIGVVKKSESGICHCPGGQFYDRTTNFLAFETIGTCLASGGREPQRGQGTCPIASSSDPATMRIPGRYDRSVFGAWSDEDGDCQDTRHERLIARSTEPVELSDDGCQVVTGHWNDPYTGTIYAMASDLEIDHLVPLFYAWNRGASHWELEKQRRFANDSANLLAVGVTANRSKGAAGPLAWLPPAEEFACEYLLRFFRVIDRYDLKLIAHESDQLEQLTAEKCD